MIRTKGISRTGLAAGILLLAGLPAMAQGVGEPRLDPTNGSPGTAYDFFVQGSAKPLDPSAGQGSTGKLNGTMTIFQNAGVGDFTADILLDTNRDGLQTAILTCDGVVGAGRVGISCSGTNEDGDSIFVMIVSKAVVHGAKVGLTAGKGIGFTDKSALTFVFQGQQQ